MFYDHGKIRQSKVFYNTVEEAEWELLTWDRVSGKDNHKVYAIEVVPLYPGKEIKQKDLKRAIEILLSKIRQERLELSEIIRRTRLIDCLSSS